MNYKGNLKNISLQNRLIKEVAEMIQGDFQDLHLLKTNIELVNEICNAIEDACRYRGIKKTNKITLFFKIFEAIFGGITQEEKTHLEETINYLNTNGKIKSRPLLKYIWDHLKVALKLM